MLERLDRVRCWFERRNERPLPGSRSAGFADMRTASGAALRLHEQGRRRIRVHDISESARVTAAA
jgi:hypothetical protein